MWIYIPFSGGSWWDANAIAKKIRCGCRLKFETPPQVLEIFLPHFQEIHWLDMGLPNSFSYSYYSRPS
jgi:hypothetical protein